MKMLMLMFPSLLALPLHAQSTGEKYSGHGYAYYAVGGFPQGSDAFNGLGAGGERLLWKGLGAGAELGYIFPPRQFPAGFGLVSVNPSWHYVRNGRSSKLVPFVTGGWSLAFREGSQNLGNFGGGVTWWFRDHLGLRLEVRDHRCAGCGDFDLVIFRAALSFR